MMLGELIGQSGMNSEGIYTVQWWVYEGKLYMYRDLGVLMMNPQLAGQFVKQARFNLVAKDSSKAMWPWNNNCFWIRTWRSDGKKYRNSQGSSDIQKMISFMESWGQTIMPTEVKDWMVSRALALELGK